MNKFGLYLLLLLTGIAPAQSRGASENASATIVVTQNLQINRVQDLDFGVVYLGSSQQEISPTSDQAASFQISGQANTQYSIILPMNSSVTMTTEDGADETKRIDLNNFISVPSEGANGMLDDGGVQLLKVGATRSEISENHRTGIFSASFTVEVIY